MKELISLVSTIRDNQIKKAFSFPDILHVPQPSKIYQRRWPAGNGKVLNMSELSQHSSRHDCWLLIDGKVYDVTKFLNDHPGGDDVLLSATGKDATHDFEEVLGHSLSAKAMLDEFYVGHIDSTKAKDITISTTPNQDNKNSDLLLIRLFQFFVPLLVLSLALGVRLALHQDSTIFSMRIGLGVLSN